MLTLCNLAEQWAGLANRCWFALRRPGKFALGSAGSHGDAQQYRHAEQMGGGGISTPGEACMCMVLRSNKHAFSRSTSTAAAAPFQAICSHQAQQCGGNIASCMVAAWKLAASIQQAKSPKRSMVYLKGGMGDGGQVASYLDVAGLPLVHGCGDGLIHLQPCIIQVCHYGLHAMKLASIDEDRREIRCLAHEEPSEGRTLPSLH